MMNRIARLASSRHGRRMVSQAARYARSPKGRAQLESVRRQLASRRRWR